MRQRLSWDEEKATEIMKQADPYTMNQTRQDPPAGKYETGNPSSWAEDQNKGTPWKQEGRTETGHPAPAREAVVQAKKLEDKALKCITIAQRMLPGSDEMSIEDQATDLMYLPERSIMATLQRQTELAAKIAAECKTDKKDGAPATEGEEVDAAKKAPVVVEEKEAPEAVEAKKAPVVEEKEAPEAVEAKKAPVVEEKEAPEAVEAKKAPVVEEKEAPVAPAAEEAIEACKTASNKDLLDVLFDTADIVPQPKTGAKTLSGLVKQASSGDDSLSGLWETPPDISSVFGRNR